jgi:hypothetical protein
VAFKPNYNQQRAERNRSKQAKQEAKAREREEQVARRKAGLPDLEPSADLAGDDEAPAGEGEGDTKAPA